MNNMTKNQHFIPQFYQRFWKCEDNYIYRLNKKTGRIDKVSIKNNCSKDYLYEPDINKPNNFFENNYSEKENEYSKSFSTLIPILESGLKLKLSDKDRRTISGFIGNLISRHPDSIDEAFKSKFLDIFTIGLDDKVVEKKYVSLVFSTVQEKEISDFLYSLNIRIIKCNNLAKNIVCFSNKIFSFKDNKNNFFLYFPLSPNLLLKFDNSSLNVSYGNFEVNEFFNALCFRKSIKEIYANNKEILELIKSGHLDKIREFDKLFNKSTI